MISKDKIITIQPKDPNWLYFLFSSQATFHPTKFKQKGLVLQTKSEESRNKREVDCSFLKFLPPEGGDWEAEQQNKNRRVNIQATSGSLRGVRIKAEGTSLAGQLKLACLGNPLSRLIPIAQKVR